jgi:hypothetical protein
MTIDWASFWGGFFFAVLGYVVNAAIRGLKRK